MLERTFMLEQRFLGLDTAVADDIQQVICAAAVQYIYAASR